MATQMLKSSGGKVYSLITNATGAVTGDSFQHLSSKTNRCFQAVVTGTGAVSASVDIEVSNNGTNWNVLTTMAPSGTTAASVIYTPTTNHFSWGFIRGKLNTISGTGATLNLTVGV